MFLRVACCMFAHRQLSHPPHFFQPSLPTGDPLNHQQLSIHPRLLSTLFSQSPERQRQLSPVTTPPSKRASRAFPGGYNQVSACMSVLLPPHVQLASDNMLERAMLG
jgi:hypothetical protein